MRKAVAAVALLAMALVAGPRLDAIPSALGGHATPPRAEPQGTRWAMMFAQGAKSWAPSAPSYVGMISCLDPVRRGVRHVATGWLVGSPDTVITAAHSFYKADPDAVLEARLDPVRCLFSLTDSGGRVWDIIGIRYAVSEWATGPHDHSSDVAVVKLVRAPQRPVRLPRLATPEGASGDADVRLVAVHASGAMRSRGPIVTEGQIHRFQHRRSCSEGFCVLLRNRMFVSCAASASGSSGGLYLDREGAAVGLHLGHFCGDPRGVFSQTSCFNYGVFIDDRIRAMIARVNADAVGGHELIR